MNMIKKEKINKTFNILALACHFTLVLKTYLFCMRHLSAENPEFKASVLIVKEMNIEFGIRFGSCWLDTIYTYTGYDYHTEDLYLFSVIFFFSFLLLSSNLEKQTWSSLLQDDSKGKTSVKKVWNDFLLAPNNILLARKYGPTNRGFILDHLLNLPIKLCPAQACLPIRVSIRVCAESRCVQGRSFSRVPNMRVQWRLGGRQCPLHTYLPVPAQPCWWWGRRGSCAAGPLLDKEAFRWEGLMWGHTPFTNNNSPIPSMLDV